MAFKKGDRVVFVDKDPMAGVNTSYGEKVAENIIYTVSKGNFPRVVSGDGIMLEGLMTYWSAASFRLAQTQYRSVGISKELAKSFTETLETSEVIKTEKEKAI